MNKKKQANKVDEFKDAKNVCSWNASNEVNSLQLKTLSLFLPRLHSPVHVAMLIRYFCLSPVPIEYPPNITVQSTSSSTIDVSWQPVNPALIHETLLGYEVRFAKEEEHSLTWETKSLDSITYKITLTGLEHFTRYKIVVCAKTSEGCGKEYSTFSDTWEKGECHSFLIYVWARNQCRLSFLAWHKVCENQHKRL